MAVFTALAAGLTAATGVAATGTGVAAGIGLGLAGLGTIKSQQAQKKAAKTQRQQQLLDDRRQRRSAIREMQIRRAQMSATAQSAGSLESSGFSGGVSSLQSQLGGAQGFASQMTGLSGVISSATQSANTWNAVAGLGGTLFGQAGGFSAFGSGGSGSTRTPKYMPN